MVKHPSRSRWRVGSFGVVSFVLWSSILPEADGGSGDMRKSQRVTGEIYRYREEAKRRGYTYQNVKDQAKLERKVGDSKL